MMLGPIAFKSVPAFFEKEKNGSKMLKRFKDRLILEYRIAKYMFWLRVGQWMGIA